MLISSHRHTAADLALWREHEEADRCVSVPRSLVDESIAAIRHWVAGGHCHAGTSWGKDSVVMLHLLHVAVAGIPVVYMRLADGRDNPDCETVRDHFLRKYPLDYHERVFRYEDCRHGEHWSAIDAEFGPRRMTALRRDESTARRMSIGVHGLDTGTSFRPIGYWRQEHIFAWLARHALPVHPAYAMLGGGRWSRQHLRVHSIGGTRGEERGRAEWEREYYGDVVRRLSVSACGGPTP